jgi:hypothetical protein
MAPRGHLASLAAMQAVTAPEIEFAALLTATQGNPSPAEHRMADQAGNPDSRSIAWLD